MRRSGTEEVILEVLDAAVPGVWLPRFLGHSTSFTWKVESLWRVKFPDRRNRPTHANVERALAKLVEEGLIEKREGKNDTYYRRHHPA